MSGKKTKEITLGELAQRIGGKLSGQAGTVVRGAAGIVEASPDEITFLANARYEKHVAKTQAAAVIVGEGYKGPGKSLIRCQDPYFAFREAMVLLYGWRKHPFGGVSRQAGVDPSAKLGKNVSVAAFATICAGSTVGDNTVIYPGAFVGPDCRVGRDCILYPNVVLYEGTILGDRVTIHSGSVIGQDGFGYATHAGRHEKIPTPGRVEIGDDVEIGAGCAIDRATVGATVIGAGTKFSNLIAIGHGTRIGKGCLLVAQVGVAGSVTIGDYCAFAGQVGVNGHIHIGNNVRVGAKSGVINDVADGQELLGQPAIPLSDARRVYTLLPQLPQLRQQIKKLQAEIEQLKKSGK